MDKLTEVQGTNTFTLLFSRYVAGLKTFLSTPAGLQLKVKEKVEVNKLIYTSYGIFNGLEPDVPEFVPQGII